MFALIEPDSNSGGGQFPQEYTATPTLEFRWHGGAELNADSERSLSLSVSVRKQRFGIAEE